MKAKLILIPLFMAFLFFSGVRENSALLADSSNGHINAMKSQEPIFSGNDLLNLGDDYISPSDLVLPSPGAPLLENVNVTVNIVFVGVPASLVNVTTIQSNVLRWYAPIDRMKNLVKNYLIPYVNYTYEYNIEFASSSLANAYAQFLIDNHHNSTAPYWLQESPYNSANASYINATAAEEWFATNFPSYLDNYTIFIVDTNHTSPSFPYRYFYNGSVADPDSRLDPRRSASKYMITYGGHHRFLFLDLNAGPTEYEDVDSTTIPPIWIYSLGDAASFSTDVANYVNKAIEERFTPSWIYAPRYFEEYHIEVTIFNNDTSFNYLNYINLSKIIEEHQILQPLSSWSGEIKQVNLTSDSTLCGIVQGAYNPSTGIVNFEPIYSYLLGNLSRYITPYDNARIVPVFVFAFPQDISFEILGAALDDTQGDPALILIGTNQYLLGQKFYNETFWDTSLNVYAGSYAYAWCIIGDIGGKDQLNGTIAMSSGKTDFYLMDEVNFNQWKNGQPYKAHLKEVGISGEYVFSFTPPSYTKYYLVFDNPYSPTIARGRFKAFYYYLGGYGLTQTAIHEIGHFVCLSHPHDNFDWDIGEYSYWLWDFSATPMTYAAQNFRFDQFDSDAVHRGRTIGMLNATYGLLNYVKSNMLSHGFTVVPPNVYSNITESLYWSSLAEGNFSTLSSIENYRTSLNNSLTAYQYALRANSTLFSSLLSITDQIQDANGNPLVNAEVRITYPNGTLRTVYTNSSGFFALKDAPWGDFTYMVYWQGTEVSGTLTFFENASVVRIIPVSVYSLSFAFKDDSGVLAISPSRWMVKAPNGTISSLLTGSIAQAQNGTWELWAVYWQGNNVVPLTHPTLELMSNHVWTIECRVYQISFINAFKDSDGVPLYPLPSSFKLRFPNNTVSVDLNTSLSYYIQNGTTTWNSIVWQGSEVSPGASFDPTDGNPTVNCRVYNVAIGFKDADGNVISNPSEYTLTFPNQTSRTLSSFTFKCQNGTIIVTSIMWQSSEVVPSPNPTLFVTSSQTYYIITDVFNPKFAVKKPNGTTPLADATMRIRFPNGTITNYQTDSNGEITLRVQKGVCHINVTRLDGYTVQVNYPVSITATQTYIIPTTEVVIDQIFVSDDRCDAGSNETVCFHARWAHNNSDTAWGTIFVNGTEYITNGTGWVSLQETYQTIGKRIWMVSGISCYGITAYEKAVSDPFIIWDRIKIVEGGVTHALTNITQTEMVWFRAIYEYDSVAFDGLSGMLFVNGSAMMWSANNNRWEYNYTFYTVGTRTFKISGVSDTQYGLTIVNDAVGAKSIAWRHFQIIFEEATYVIPIDTNSTISSLAFNQTLMQISFNVTGHPGTFGFCNFTIPKNLLNDNGTHSWWLYLNGVNETYLLAPKVENTTHTFLYFTFIFTQNTHKVTVIGSWAVPEFPTIIILPLLMIITLVATVVGKIILSNRPRNKEEEHANWH